jgi:ribosomal protein S12 methylthiotransferase
MKRPANEEKTLERIRNWRRLVPDLTLRSTFIVGFPGETEEDFAYLLDWLEEARIDRAGAFKYEPVAGAPANDLGLAPVPDEVKESRWKRFMERQQAISARLLKQKIGQRIQVIVDEPGSATLGGAARNIGGASGPAKGRGKADAPGVDGAVHISSRRPLRAGDIVSVKVEGADAYDLRGTAT